MMNIRHSKDRGHANFGWLNAKHSFSFASYYDPNHMGFSDLRVINEDRIAPSKGFGTHSHKDMEIVTYVLAGELEHKDSIGNGSIIRVGDVQRMSAGSGIAHSEFNASAVTPVHLLQIWIEPNRFGIEPSYEQKNFSDEQKRGQLKLVASNDGRNDSMTIHQDASLYVSILENDDRLTYDVAENRAVWLQVVKGKLKINDRMVETGDGVSISEENAMSIVGVENESEFLLFDLIDK